ncbi:hypothetical protein Trisim1_012428 [Trichoderma cf. simile WF8]
MNKLCLFHATVNAWNMEAAPALGLTMIWTPRSVSCGALGLADIVKFITNSWSSEVLGGGLISAEYTACNFNGFESVPTHSMTRQEHFQISKRVYVTNKDTQRTSMLLVYGMLARPCSLA